MKGLRWCAVFAVGILIVAALTGCLTFRNSRPQALFTASTARHVIPFTASFDATLSYNPEGTIQSYLWSFGDGGSDSGPLVDHTFIQSGTFEVRLTVIDGQGISSSTTMTVEALNPLPEATFSYSPKSQMEGEYVVGASEWITFDARESTDDGEIVGYEWNFGDGTYGVGPVVEHRYLYPGTYNVVLTVTDNEGGATSHIQKINIVGGPPCHADITGDVQWNYGGDNE